VITTRFVYRIWEDVIILVGLPILLNTLSSILNFILHCRAQYLFLKIYFTHAILLDFVLYYYSFNLVHFVCIDHHNSLKREESVALEDFFEVTLPLCMYHSIFRFSIPDESILFSFMILIENDILNVLSNGLFIHKCHKAYLLSYPEDSVSFFYLVHYLVFYFTHQFLISFMTHPQIILHF